MATEILKRPQMGPWRRSEKWLFLVFLVGFEDKEIFIVVELVMMFILINVFLNCVCRRLVSLERNFEVVVAVRLADDFTISAKTFETVFEAANAFCRHINTCDKIYCHDFSSFECTPAFLEYSTKKDFSIEVFCFSLGWWSIRDSNPWPQQCECCALSAELIPQHLKYTIYFNFIYFNFRGWL